MVELEGLIIEEVINIFSLFSFLFLKHFVSISRSGIQDVLCLHLQDEECFS